MKPLILACKLLRREWYAGELRILIVALLIAVTCMTSINLFAKRIQTAMLTGSSKLLGGDLALSSSSPLPKSWATYAKTQGIAVTETVNFLSILTANNQFQLASVKAASEGYPLRGQIKVASTVNQPSTLTRTIPTPGTIWLESNLLPLLKIHVGDQVNLGSAPLTVTRLISFQPETLHGIFFLSPIALMNMADVPKTQVIQPGSQIQYMMLFASSPAQIAGLKAWLKPQVTPMQKLFGADESNASLQKNITRIQHFLGLCSLISVILGGVALIVALRQFSHRHYDMVALMRSFGSSSRQVLMVYVWMFLIVAALSTFIGIMLGYLTQAILGHILSSIIAIDLPPAGFSGILFGSLAGAIVLIFGLPPLLQLTSIPPLKVFHRELPPVSTSNTASYIIGLITTCVFILWYVQDFRLTAIIFGGCLLAACLFLLGAIGLLSLTKLAKQRVGVAWRYGFTNLSRHWRSSLIQITAFGFTLMTVSLFFIVRNDLLATWQNQLPPNAPNYFVINIAPNQVSAIKLQLMQDHIKVGQISPMIIGRIYQLNGKPILEALPSDKRHDESLNRDLHLSWTSTLPDNNKMVAGHWWQPGETKVISVEQGFAQRLGLKLGDELDFRIGADTITAKIVNIRQLYWSSMQPNFYVLFPPGILESFPSTYMTSFYLPLETDQAKLNALLHQFPNLTVINIAEIMRYFQNFLKQGVYAIQYAFFFALLSGLVVLYASVYSTLDERIHESALLRALGANRYQLLTSLLAEFITLGALAGLLGSIVANLIGMALGYWLLDLYVSFNFGLVLMGAGIGILIIGLIGMYATHSVLNQSPMLALSKQ